MTGALSVTSSASGKRKRGSPAFYAVKVGRTPGVYQSWEDAQQQINGFAGAVYKKFDTHAEAQAMVNGAASAAPKAGKSKFYGVAVGSAPGVYKDWPSAQAQIKGIVGAKYKSFGTHEEAVAWVKDNRKGGSKSISLRGDLTEYSLSTGAKRAKKTDTRSATPLTNGDVQYEPGQGPLPPGAEDGFDRTIKLDPETGTIRRKTADELNATKLQPTGDFSGPIVVYTDGSALGNGRLGAVGGVGVYFGPDDSRNVSEPLRGPRQTNQRAELTAISRALDHIPLDREALIITDSHYSIQCVTVWVKNWEKNGWRTGAGKPVENRDLVEMIVVRIRERTMAGAETRFRWVKGHAGDEGNGAADQLAVMGSRRGLAEGLETDVVIGGSRHEVEQQKESEERPQDDGAEYEELFRQLEAERAADNGFGNDLLFTESAVAPGTVKEEHGVDLEFSADEEELQRALRAAEAAEAAGSVGQGQ